MARRPWYRRPSRLLPTVALLAGVAVAGATLLSPWPGALAIRALFEHNGRVTAEEMSRHAPESGVTSRLDVDTGAPGSRPFDLFAPAAADPGPRPAVIWIHGGAWISGEKGAVGPYLRLLASEGYVAVGLDYALGPEHVYPDGLRELASTIAAIADDADRYGIDASRIVLAGDSAGANLASQLALLVTDPAYAAEVGIPAPVERGQLRGVVLNCGIYDVSGIPDAPGITGWGFRVALWSYLGERDWSRTAGAEQMSTLDRVTAAFPPTWISGGNGDPLTATQSEPLARRLEELGVVTVPFLFPDDHEPRLGHEYQFELDDQPARGAFDSTIRFLDAAVDGGSREE
ncbi:alpha/beta hydrolase [Homoserinibacter sp. YIM 151385]|uniref:alpha/beta hydrolase n=1 Tax=Homoserinibacter sp. YIM 151385 TaxID=2985506 RepID=UPI0022F0F669|nr:alpha/beta hydrolase [Homoserinibacter sp. YIM 151385]WBU37152.1 alpha/beta hydrolase [Homoserinibacter sp. YIM 151385]